MVVKVGNVVHAEVCLVAVAKVFLVPQAKRAVAVLSQVWVEPQGLLTHVPFLQEMTTLMVNTMVVAADAVKMAQMVVPEQMVYQAILADFSCRVKA